MALAIKSKDSQVKCFLTPFFPAEDESLSSSFLSSPKWLPTPLAFENIVKVLI